MQKIKYIQKKYYAFSENNTISCYERSSTIFNFADNIKNTSQVNDNKLNFLFATNLQESIVNDAVNSRIDQNSINVPIINRNQNINSYQNINEAMYEFANNIKDNFETNINIKTNKSTVPV